MQPNSATPLQFTTAQVLLRFLVRIVILTVASMFGRQGFASAAAIYFALAALFCAVIGIVRREALLARILTHWDEAAACGLLACLAAKFA